MPLRASCRVLPAPRLFQGCKNVKSLFRMAVSSSLCSLGHWVKCSVVSCCSPTAEYRPLSFIHSVNKSSVGWSTRSAANRVTKTTSARPMAAGGQHGGGATREEEEGPQNVSKENNPPSKKTSSLLCFFCSQLLLIMIDFTVARCTLCAKQRQQSIQGDSNSFLEIEIAYYR